MKKIINTFKNGTPYTKKILLGAIGSGIGILLFLILAVVFKTILFFFGSIICLFIMIALIQTLSVKEFTDSLSESAAVTIQTDNSIEDEIQKEKVNQEKVNQEKEHQEKEHQEKEHQEKEHQEKENKEKKQKEKKKLKKQKSLKEGKQKEKQKGKQKENKKQNKQKLEKEKKADLLNESEIENNKIENDSNGEHHYFDNNKTKNESEYEAEYDDEVGITDELITEDADEKEVTLQATDEELKSYNNRKLKKVFHKYKVKRDHKKILIDKCEKYNIVQTPAYVWLINNELHMLLIEQEPRELVIPVIRLNYVSYLKKVEVNPDVDYPAFHKKNLITEVFKGCLPDYIHSTVQGDMSAYKNLYGFGPGIYVTNRSVKQIFDLLALEFRVEDKVTTSNKVNLYFKEAYKSSILLKDNVIDANGYADRISNTLDDMAKSTISYNEFKDTLNLMIKNKLITQEFAMYYMGVRDKNRV